MLHSINLMARSTATVLGSCSRRWLARRKPRILKFAGFRIARRINDISPLVNSSSWWSIAKRNSYSWFSSLWTVLKWISGDLEYGIEKIPTIVQNKCKLTSGDDSGVMIWTRIRWIGKEIFVTLRIHAYFHIVLIQNEVNFAIVLHEPDKWDFPCIAIFNLDLVTGQKAGAVLIFDNLNPCSHSQCQPTSCNNLTVEIVIGQAREAIMRRNLKLLSNNRTQDNQIKNFATLIRFASKRSIRSMWISWQTYVAITLRSWKDW